MNIYTQFIVKATWKKAALFTLIFLFFYVVANFSNIGVAGLLKITGGANILDFEFGFSQDEAYRMLEALGPEGRAFYLTKILPVDFPFPFSYMLFFSGWIALILKHIVINDKYKYILLIPVIAMAADWAENAGIIAMLCNYPNISATAASLSSIAGMVKTVFTVGSFAAIGLLFIIMVIMKIASKKNK